VISAILLGLLVGSFFNMLIYRLSSGVSLFSPVYSFCPQCKHRLKAVDLIPLFSFIIQKGRCRYCKEKIPKIYFFMEIIILSLSLILYYRHGLTLIYLIKLLLYSFWVGAFVVDIRIREVPYTFSVSMAILVVIARGIDFIRFKNAGIIFLVLLGLAYIGKLIYKKDVFGGGDILLLTIGVYFFTSAQIGIFLYFPFVIGAIVGSIIMLINKEKMLPFVPFIAVSFFISDFFGESIARWYLSFF